jgi:hypothetical protein
MRIIQDSEESDIEETHKKLSVQKHVSGKNQVAVGRKRWRCKPVSQDLEGFVVADDEERHDDSDCKSGWFRC